MARRRATVNSQARQSASFPRNLEVTQQGRVGIVPQHCEGGITARLRGPQHVRKLIANHRAEYRHACPFSQQIRRLCRQPIAEHTADGLARLRAVLLRPQAGVRPDHYPAGLSAGKRALPS